MFVIWWGTNVTRKELGYVAEFCRICHEIRPFRYMERLAYRQVYNLPTSTAQVIGHLIRCDTCGIEFDLEQPLEPVASVADLKGRRWEETENRHSARVEIERRRAEGKLTAHERDMLLREPFDMFESMAGSIAKTSSLSSHGNGLFFLLGAIGVLAMAFTFALAIPHPKYEKAPPPAVLSAPVFLLGLWLLYKSASLFATARQREIRAKIHPFLAQALAPVRPTLEELIPMLT